MMSELPPGWRQRDEWWLESDSGERISKATVNGRPVYTAWAPGPPDNPYSFVSYSAVAYSPSLAGLLSAIA